jgi:hypothetical protein
MLQVFYIIISIPAFMIQELVYLLSPSESAPLGRKLLHLVMSYMANLLLHHSSNPVLMVVLWAGIGGLGWCFSYVSWVLSYTKWAPLILLGIATLVRSELGNAEQEENDEEVGRPCEKGVKGNPQRTL